MIKETFKKLFGSRNDKALQKIYPLIQEIKKYEEEFLEKLKDQNDVLAKSSEFKERIKEGESLDSILPEAYALVKTACHHLQGKEWDVRGKKVKWDMIPYDVQLIGGIVMHQGNIAEMKTGEGKTLVCTLPCYLNALTEKGVFVVTVNEYLAKRDAEWMEGLYNYLGLSVGTIYRGMTKEEKKHAYSCDITYGTNNEFGFDYLRDNMTNKLDNVVQKELNFAIIDEVDSILIDESRTPLIISAPEDSSTEKYAKYSGIINQLKENEHYDIDEKGKTAVLTEEGVKKMEEILGIENIYTEGGFEEVHHIEQALRAEACYKKDVDYIVQEEKVIIIDEFTGRLMPGRRFGQGLHQAIEAKEKVNIRQESKTLATITFQNYFRMFNKLAGMTGTAETEAEEFYQIYGLDTIVIPTNKPIARDDKADAIYKNQKGKYLAVVKKIKELHEKGQPALVGTISVERSELISRLLSKDKIPHNVLNAKNHAKEAEIVENAGAKGAVTIATNMAGRGTDIKISKEVKELGGLFVLGTERHESRRIDNQLRGRSGRQGDPGASQFFVSMEDDLMRLFGGEKIQKVMNFLSVPDDMPIENKTISNSIESAQKKVEGRNFDIRKHLVEYDDVMNIHRTIIYKKRNQILKEDNLKEIILDLIESAAETIVKNHSDSRPKEDWNFKEIFESLNALHSSKEISEDKLKSFNSQEELIKFAQDYLSLAYSEKMNSLPTLEMRNEIEKVIYLRTCDMLWMEHINEMKHLRENVAFSGYAQKNPLNEYKSQSYEMFQKLLANIDFNTINTLFKIDISKVAPAEMLEKSEVKNSQTNEEQVKANPKGAENKSQTITHSTYQDNDNPVIIKAAPVQATNTKFNNVGRNDPCPCGSGKKFKKCHGAN